MGGTPILILKEGTRRERGKDAQYDNIMAARTAADALKSTLGPRGMDKMLVDSVGDVVITNDGVTILKDMEIQHPAAKMVVEVAKALDEECGDGTTTAVILVGELLKKSLDLIDSDVHPTVITNGFRMASERGIELLETLALPTGIDDPESLKKIATTAMMSKAVTGSREHMADLAVRAVTEVADRSDSGITVDLDNIQIVKREGGSMDDTELIQGVIFDSHPAHPSMPRAIRGARIALISSPLEIKKTEISAEIQITDPSQIRAFLDEEKGELRRMVQQLKDAGTNAIFCQKGIDDLVQHLLAMDKIPAFQRVKGSDLEKLARATGANIVSKPSELEEGDLGTAASIEVRKLEDKETTFVIGCKNPRSVSILIRGGTTHVVDEADRSLDDALNVVRLAVEDGAMVTGGGSTAVELAMGIRKYADSVGGREQLAIGAFASALEIVPVTLAENAGLDPLNILIDLRKAHQAGDKYAGLNVFKKKVVDMRDDNILEPIRVSRQVLTSATEAASMIIRIDDVIASKGGAGGPGPAGGMEGLGEE